MLMQAEKVYESEQLANCRKLLNYIDTDFQERLTAGQVDWNRYGDCKTYGCLIGWYQADIIGRMYPIMTDYADHFGLSGPLVINSIFGFACRGDIHARRAALVDHIKHLEAQEMLEAA